MEWNWWRKYLLTRERKRTVWKGRERKRESEFSRALGRKRGSRLWFALSALAKRFIVDGGMRRRRCFFWSQMRKAGPRTLCHCTAAKISTKSCRKEKLVEHSFVKMGQSGKVVFVTETLYKASPSTDNESRCHTKKLNWWNLICFQLSVCWVCRISLGLINSLNHLYESRVSCIF